MTAGMGYALAAMVCYGAGDFIYKRSAAAGVKAHHFLMVQAWFVCPLAFLYAAATDTLVIRPSAAWGGLAGLFIFIGFYNFLRSLATGSVSISAPIFRLNFVITAFLAIWLLGEPFTLHKMVGVGLALIAVWLLLGGLGQDKRATTELNRRSLVHVLIATLAFGSANFFHKLGLEYGALPETLFASQAVVFIAFSTLFAGFTDRALKPPAATWTHSVQAGLVLIGAFLFLLHGLSVGQASVLVPIAQMGFVVTAALGIIFLGEALTPRKLVGLGAALTALAVLAIG